MATGGTFVAEPLSFQFLSSAFPAPVLLPFTRVINMSYFLSVEGLAGPIIFRKLLHQFRPVSTGVQRFQGGGAQHLKISKL